MGPKSEKILSEAFDKVTARQRATWASGAPVPFEQFVREVIAEVCAEAGRREARNLRRIRKADRRARKAARRALEAAELIAIMGQSPVFGDVTAECEFTDSDVAGFYAAMAEKRLPDGHGAAVPGLPPWHPDHPHHENNQE